MGQEGADQAGVTPADVLLEGAFHPVLDVAHLYPARVPANRQVAQRRAQHKVVLPQLRRGAEVEPSPQPGVQEDLAQLAACQREAPATVLIQEGEKVQEALAVELGDVHGERPQSERPPWPAGERQQWACSPYCVAQIHDASGTCCRPCTYKAREHHLFWEDNCSPAGRCGSHTFPLICHRSQQAAWGEFEKNKTKLGGADVYTDTASFSQSEKRQDHWDAQQRDSSAGQPSLAGVWMRNMLHFHFILTLRSALAQNRGLINYLWVFFWIIYITWIIYTSSVKRQKYLMCLSLLLLQIRDKHIKVIYWASKNVFEASGETLQCQ